MDRTPLETTRADFGTVLVERAQVLDREVEFLAQKFNILLKIRVFEFLRIHQFQGFQGFALYHLKSCKTLKFMVLNLLQDVSEGRENDSDDLFFRTFRKNISHDLDAVLGLDLFGDSWIEGEGPETEDQLILQLEVSLSFKSILNRVNSIDIDEGLAIFINTKHHLETAGSGVDIFIILEIK